MEEKTKETHPIFQQAKEESNIGESNSTISLYSFVVPVLIVLIVICLVMGFLVTPEQYNFHLN